MGGQWSRRGVWQPPALPPRARSRTGPVPLPPLRLVDVGGTGPEDVVVDGAGRIVTGVADGRLLRIDPDSGRVERIADTGGRPLGIELLPDGRLLVCDARRGLLAVDPEGGSVETLTGEPMLFCNNAAVAADGTVWFSDSSGRFGIDHWRAEMLEHSGTGRLLRRDPGGAVEVVLDGLEFANGVALSADEDFVVVAETGAYRLRRVWLRGDRAGTDDVFVENLPGIPANVSTGPDGLFWVALARLGVGGRGAPPRRASPAVHLPAPPPRPSRGGGAVPLCRRDRHAQVGIRVGQAAGRVPGARARLRQQHPQLGEPVLEPLERADRPAELVPRLQVLDGRVEAPLRDAELLAGQQDCAGRACRPDRAGHQPARCARERDVGQPPRQVERGHRHDPRVGGLDREHTLRARHEH